MHKHNVAVICIDVFYSIKNTCHTTTTNSMSTLKYANEHENVYQATFVETLFRVYYMDGVFAATNCRAIIVAANFANIKTLM
jgi:hypothetical protein